MNSFCNTVFVIVMQIKLVVVVVVAVIGGKLIGHVKNMNKLVE